MVMMFKRNRIRCKHCNDIIESKSLDDCVFCDCGKVRVDGGLIYLGRTFPTSPEEDFEELSEWEELK